MSDRDDQEYFGLILMLAGALIAGLGGACTWNAIHSRDNLYGTLPLFTGAPMLGGLVMFVFGLLRFLRSRE